MKYTKDNPLRCFFAFEGYNSQGLALDRLKRDYPDFDWVCVGRSEIESSAIKAADVLFPGAKGKNFGSICDIDWSQVPDFDLFTWSFPCTDISNAGKQCGLSKQSGTRSSLAWEAIRAIREKRPSFAVMENVPALMQAKFKNDFAALREELEEIGYENYVGMVNSKDMGVAQNRNRVFMISILSNCCNQTYHFPNKIPLTKCVEDYLESAEIVDESYFIDQERVTDEILSDIMDQPNVREFFELRYHMEEGCRRLFGKRLKGKEWEEHEEEIYEFTKNMLAESI